MIYKKHYQNPEAKIKKEILGWLTSQRNCFVWQNDSVGIYDPIKKTFRRKTSSFCIRGVSDILGIWNGRPLAIEVKSLAGKVSDYQKDFLEKFVLNGGIGFIARSLSDVVEKLIQEQSL